MLTTLNFCLKDILAADNVKLDWFFRLSFANDIATVRFVYISAIAFDLFLIVCPFYGLEAIQNIQRLKRFKIRSLFVFIIGLFGDNTDSGKTTKTT